MARGSRSKVREKNDRTKKKKERDKRKAGESGAVRAAEA